MLLNPRPHIPQRNMESPLVTEVFAGTPGVEGPILVLLFGCSANAVVLPRLLLACMRFCVPSVTLGSGTGASRTGPLSSLDVS